MLYDSYVEKVLRIKKRRDLIYKFRYLIISSIVIVLATIVTLLSVKGNITEFIVPQSVTYGDTLEVSAKALWSDTEIEYLINDTWQSESPKECGSYQVRARSNRSFGVKGIKEASFTILPKEVTVEALGDSVEYGDNPLPYATLSYNDKITSCSFNLENPQIDGNVTATPILDSIKVESESGKDVTNCYNFICQSKLLAYTKRNVTVEAASNSKVYDLEELTSKEEYKITEGSLLEGDTLELTYEGSIVDVGETSNKITSVKVLNSSGLDITSFYNITTVDGVLKVTPYTIYVTTSSNTKEYDGTSLESLEFSLNNDSSLLSENHQITSTDGANITYFGTLDNTLTYQILDGERDITSNYLVVEECGTLSITPKNITIITATDTKEYDGTSLSNSNYSLSDQTLVEGDRIVVTDSNQILDFGEVNNTITLSIYHDSLDISSSYNVTYEYGTLSITKTDLSLVVSDAEKVYDSTPLTSNEYQIVTNLSEELVSTANLSGTITDYGSTLNHINLSSVRVYRVLENETKDITENFNFIETPGTLTILKREISVKPDDATYTYNGLAQTATSYQITSEVTLAGNDRFEPLSYTESRTNSGVTQNNQISEFAIYRDNLDITENYIVNLESATITINKLELEITLGSLTKEYDSTPLTCEEYTFDRGSNQIIEGHTLNVTYQGSITNVGSTSNIMIDYSVTDLNGVNQTDNYQVYYTDGRLEVTERHVSIYILDKEKVYDGTPLTSNEWDYNLNSKTILESNVILTTTGTITTYGSTENEGSIRILDSSNTDLTRNYNVNIVSGTLSILKRDITLATASDSKVYDALPLTNSNVEYTNDLSSVTGNITIEALTTGTQTDVGTTQNSIDDSTILVYNNGIDVTSSFNILDITLGTLEVTKRDITLKVSDLEVTYDSLNHTQNEADSITLSNLASGEEVVLQTDQNVKNVGAYTNTITSYQILKSDLETDSTNNYNILEVLTGTITINKLEIEITASSRQKTYDGTPLTDSTYTITKGNVAVNDTISITIEGSVQSVSEGIIENKITEILITDTNTLESTIDNYSYTLVSGTLEILERIITITADSAEKTYDKEVLTCNSSSITEGMLAEGDTYTAVITGEITSSGSVENIISDVIIYNSLNQDITSEYDITLINGLLTVNKINLTIASGASTKAYDGEYLENNSVEIVTGSLAEGDTLEYTVTPESRILYPGQTRNNYTYDILDENSISNLSNYNVTQNYGTLEVTKMNITIAAKNITREYTGEVQSLTNTDYLITSGTLASTSTVSITLSGSLRVIGEAEVRILSANIYTEIDGVLTDITERCYNVTLENGSIKIVPRRITLLASSASKEWDAYPLVLHEYTIISGSLIDGDNLIVSFSPESEIVSIGTVDNIISSVEIYDQTGRNVTGCYEITTYKGTLEVYGYGVSE